MDFGQALHALWDGERVARKTWSQTQFICLVSGIESANAGDVSGALVQLVVGRQDVRILPRIDMVISPTAIQPGWIPSQVDLLSSDWVTR